MQAGNFELQGEPPESLGECLSGVLGQAARKSLQEPQEGEAPLSRAEQRDLALRCAFRGWREALLVGWGWSPADIEELLLQPYPTACSTEQPARMTRERYLADVREPQVRKQLELQASLDAEQAAQRAASALSVPELSVLANALVLLWSRDLPADLGRKPLPLTNPAGYARRKVYDPDDLPRDVASDLGQAVRRFIEECCPLQHGRNPVERLPGALRWVRGVVELVYANEWANGLNEHRGGREVALEWLVESCETYEQVDTKGGARRREGYINFERLQDGMYGLRRQKQEA